MPTSLSAQESATVPLLRVQGLSKTYVRGGLLQKRVSIRALNEVDFEIRAGQTLALVGASGSGKSTLARCVTRLERPDSGQIWIDGTDIARLRSCDLLPFRSRIQVIFQDASTSMNPRFSAAEVIEEPLRIQGKYRSDCKAITELIVKEVALSPDWLQRPISEFSGGQRKRLALARALILQPRLLVLDEALSELDLSTQAQIANLLLGLQTTRSLSYLLISHDLALVARMADVIAVMSEGRIVELGASQQILFNPKQAETRNLLASARAAESKLALSAGASA